MILTAMPGTKRLLGRNNRLLDRRQNHAIIAATQLSPFPSEQGRSENDGNPRHKEIAPCDLALLVGCFCWLCVSLPRCRPASGRVFADRMARAFPLTRMCRSSGTTRKA